MEIPIIFDLLIVYALAIAVIFVCHRLGIPPIVGFILTGVLSGPQVLGLIKAVHEVEILAEIGVILLLFTIGIEFSFANLLQLRRSVLIGGPLQVAATVIIFFLLAWQMGLGMGESVFIGFLISLSSTAIVLKILQSKAEVETPHGNTSLGVLIFQDIIIVPMMLFTPFLAGIGGNEVGSMFLSLLLKGLVIIVLVVVSAKWVVPQVLYQIARTRDREIFLLAVLVLCFVVAWATAAAGLSLALGAFLAGLILSETEYSHQALGNILPFRDIFASIFFISIGMLLNVEFLFQEPLSIALLAVLVLAAKALIAGGAALVLGFPLRTTIIVGLTICQVGEFSFILSKAGVAYGLLSGENYQMFLDISVLTMALTPFIIGYAPRLADGVMRLPLPSRLKTSTFLSAAPDIAQKEDHLIIIGYGVTGRNVARAAQSAGIPYVVTEMNPETVRYERQQGRPIYFGDATNPEILHLANIHAARIVVIAINDPAATRRITELARKLNRTVYIIVRTRYLAELEALFELGADEVVPEEFETSVEIFTRVLRKYLVPKSDIEKFIQEVRAGSYRMLRGMPKDFESLEDLRHYLKDVEISTIRLEPGAPLEGKTLAEMELRKRHGISVLAVRRGAEMLFNPEPDMKLNANDVLIVLGTPEKIAAGGFLFAGEGESA
ncbi:MAG: cation:proton antiporter [Deltaproteobacteria bacterium]|nr:cation:proton antiporter [Deltaproteobacteria bacterium]